MAVTDIGRVGSGPCQSITERWEAGSVGQDQRAGDQRIVVPGFSPGRKYFALRRAVKNALSVKRFSVFTAHMF